MAATAGSTTNRRTFLRLAPPDADRAAAAHLLRRTAMSVHPERVDELAGRSWDDAVRHVLDKSENIDAPPVPSSDDWWKVGLWWVNKMTEPETGLTDRLAWFWHGLLTTNAYKVSETSLIASQLGGLRANARGNFRTLLQDFIASGALLEYLDAAGSIASNPNENLGRELMELFTVGRGHYTEDDVRAAARALAGWVVDDGEVLFRRENAFIAPLLFLGEQDEWDGPKIVDRLCDHPATAARVSARLWLHFVGTHLSEEASAALGRWWQERDLNIEPLIERILEDATFATNQWNKPRSGLEWYCAAKAAVGFDNDDLWQLENLGQSPYLPPNVAGWSDDLRWLSPGSLNARASVTYSVDLAKFVRPEATTAEVLEACSLAGASAATVAALDAVDRVSHITPEEAGHARWRLALTSPEFHLS